uniref:Uncharacterized protein LOC100182150 n=1 Tax=Phallusia mammillata TaxID=59560 RepID=A0A6F9DHN0_9ASCI|nr:uncharacterized protein LOC100182150 [Phallusia mammillata]
MLTVANQDRDGLLKELFKIYDQESLHLLTAEQVQLLYQDVRIGGLSISQVAASMHYVCGNSDFLLSNDIRSVVEEMDRRYYLVQDLQWEFALLDNLHVGRISVEKSRFLFQAVHGNLFSNRKWERFLKSRPVPLAPLAFDEIEVELCNRPQPNDWDVMDLQGGAKPRIEVKSLDRPVQKILQQAPFVEQNIRAVSPIIATDAQVTPPQSNEDTDQRLKEAAAAEAEKREEAKRRKLAEDAAKRRERDEKRKARREARRAEKQAKAMEEKERLRFNLEDAIDAEEEKLLEPAIKDYKSAKSKHRTSDDLLAKAERLLEMLKSRDALKDATTRRIIADLEEALKKARKMGFHRSEDELANEVAQADELLERLKRIERLRSEVLELKQSTIAEIRSYQKPMPVIHQVMTATYLLLGVPEKETKKWTTIQTLLGKTGREGLKRRISQCNINDITAAVASRARDIMGDVDLEAIRDVSAGAATFFVWVEGMIEEVLSEN